MKELGNSKTGLKFYKNSRFCFYMHNDGMTVQIKKKKKVQSDYKDLRIIVLNYWFYLRKGKIVKMVCGRSKF